MQASDFSALWGAFRAKDRDRVIVGVAAAFALVAAANGTLEPTETQRFLDVVGGSRLAPMDPVTTEALTQAFAALALALIAHPEVGLAEGLRVLSDFGFDPMRREIIWSATSAALVADAALDAEEQRMARAIHSALRVGSAG